MTSPVTAAPKVSPKLRKALQATDMAEMADRPVDEDARLHTYTAGLPADDLPALVRLLESAAARLESVSPLLSGASGARRLSSLLSLSQIKLASLAELDPGALVKSLRADEPVEPIMDKEST